jgi:hypothetical protein
VEEELLFLERLSLRRKFLPGEVIRYASPFCTSPLLKELEFRSLTEGLAAQKVVSSTDDL